MTTSTLFSASMRVPLTAGCISAAAADTNHSTGEIRKDDEVKSDRSVPCMFSPRRAYVDIDLRNGDPCTPRPMDKANRFKVQKGNTVVRTTTGGGDVGGEVDDQLRNHGYGKVTDRVDGKSVHSCWCKGWSGDCVVVHFVNLRVTNVSWGQGN